MMNCMETDTESFQRQALEIRQPGADFDPTVQPETGEEFLMHMLYERQRCPSIVVRRPKQLSVRSNLSSSSSFIIFTQEKNTSSPTLLPTVEWKEAQVEIFVAKRERISEMRAVLNANAYDSSLEPPLTTEPTEWHQFCQLHPPLLKTILRINQRSLEGLLELLCEWLKVSTDDDGDDSIDSDAPCNEACTAPSLIPPNVLDLSSSEQWLGLWLYAVLACLHLPLEPQVHSTLREIARACLFLRSSLQPQERERAVPYNLFIHLIAKVFGQLDFAEFV